MISLNNYQAKCQSAKKKLLTFKSKRQKKSIINLFSRNKILVCHRKLTVYPKQIKSIKTLNYVKQKEDGIMKFFNESSTVIRIRRIRKLYSPKVRPRSMIVTLNNPWNDRKMSAKAHELKRFPERRKFILKQLTYDK